MITLSLGGRVGVEVMQSAAENQARDLEDRFARAAEATGVAHGPTAAASLKSLNEQDWCVLTSWESAVLDDTPKSNPYPLSPSDIYEVLTVDRLDGQSASTLSDGMTAFPFVNVFDVAPDRRKEMISYFNKTILTVRRQPGYIATNFMMSIDSTHAVNIGLYETRKDFLAIFRQLDVIGDFARGAVSGILPTRFGVLPKLPRLKLYELMSTTGV